MFLFVNVGSSVFESTLAALAKVMGKFGRSLPVLVPGGTGGPAVGPAQALGST